MEYVTRAESGLVAPTSISRISASLGIFTHWTAGPVDQTVRQIQQFHMGPSRGWTDIAYSWLVDQNGTIFEGRGWGRSGAHTQGYNSSSHAVCAICGHDGEVTEVMLDGLSRVHREHDRLYGAGFHLPHRDANGASTACPGDKLAAWTRGGFEGVPLSEQTIIDAVAGFEHDTRRLILQGQIQDRKDHREQMVAEWRTRAIVKQIAADVDALTPDELAEAVATPGEKQAFKDAGFLADEGDKWMAELDVVPVQS